MSFNPDSEPCYVCGREFDECVCGLSQDLPDDLELLDDDPDAGFYDWDEIDPEEEETCDDAIGYESPD